MTTLSDRIVQLLDQAATLYHRLILVIAPPGSGKTSALAEVRDRTSGRLININLELSLRMLDLTERQRSLQLPRLLSDIVNADPIPNPLLLDNLELLFDTSLKQDPLRLLQGISRHKTVVAAWGGSIDRDYVTYAVPDHPEYKKYPRNELLVVTRPATLLRGPLETNA